MFYAVATMDTITIYDTQQAGPICLLTKLHYDEFTDITWYGENLSPLLNYPEAFL
jgi:chromatin assembly factor 1 subunit B